MRKRVETRAELFGEGYRAAVERVAANVRELRTTRGWTQEEAAFQCKQLDPTLFRVVEAARSNLTVATLVRLAEGFGVEVQALFAPAPPFKKRGRGRPKKAPAVPQLETDPPERTTTSRPKRRPPPA
ncbi:MAG: helix-turn-helix transcriptional regulator [Polyangiales bacterium]